MESARAAAHRGGVRVSWQVYRAGTANVPRSYETTPWSGVYGAPFDIGTSAGIGIGASSLTADKRCAQSIS